MTSTLRQKLSPVHAVIMLALLLSGCATTSPGIGGTQDRVPERLRMVLSPGKPGGDAVVFSPVDKEAVRKEKNIEEMPRLQRSPSSDAREIIGATPPMASVLGPTGLSAPISAFAK